MDVEGSLIRWLHRLQASVPAVLTITALFSLTSPALSQDSDAIASFCGNARSYFTTLEQRARAERKAYWDQRLNDGDARIQAKFDELRNEEEQLKNQPVWSQYQYIFAFKFLNETAEVRLDVSTRLVEELGKELLDDRVASTLTPAIVQADAQFKALAQKNPPESVQRSYGDLLKIERDVAAIHNGIGIRQSYKFMPRDNAYATEPSRTVIYEIHDWDAALKRVDDLRQRLTPVQDTLRTVAFFTPKDPLPWLPVITQLTFLMVAMAGWVKSYHDETAYWLIGSLVAVSMILSVLLVFFSQDTMLNILRQSIIPGIFILYWIAKKNRWLARLKPKG